MNDEQQKQLAADILKSQVQKKLYLYSYIFMVAIAFLNVLLAGVGMIVDLEKGLNYIYYYLAIGFGVFGLLLIAWLSALYFVNGDEAPSAGRVKAVGIIKLLIRCANTLASVFFLVASFVYESAESKGWNGFLRGFSIVILVLEGVMILYTLWKNAWIKENPDRYVTPVYPMVPGEGAVSKVTPHQAPEAKETTEVRSLPAQEKEPQMIEAKVHEKPAEKKQKKTRK
jgi:MFS family permease